MVKCNFAECTKEATCADVNAGYWTCREHVTPDKTFFELKQLDGGGFGIYRVTKSTSYLINDTAFRERAENYTYQAMLEERKALEEKQQEQPIESLVVSATS